MTLTKAEARKSCEALRKSIREKELMLQTAAMTDGERKQREENVRNARVLLATREQTVARLTLTAET